MGERFSIDKDFHWVVFSREHIENNSREKCVKYQRATPGEESKLIDGYIGNTPVSIKPITYKTKNMLHENINVKLIYYEKLKDGISVEYDF